MALRYACIGAQARCVNAMQHSGGHAVMAGAQARRHAGTQARRLAGSGSRQNSHPKGVHEHNSGIRRDSVDRGWKTELQHPIVHRHEAILIQKLRHHSVSNAATGRSCASQQTGKATGRNALERRTRSVIPPAKLVCICGGPFPSAGYFTAQTTAV